ncbi:MAG: HesA/MoeB/ThiF family protein [Flavobacteriaceae bacterium]
MNTDRYSRQIILKDFGEQGQQKLSNAKVLVVGAGGLGLPILTYLNAMGVGTIGIVDHDVVSVSNLHRQFLYDASDIGKPKVEVSIRRLQAQNPETELIGYTSFLIPANALKIISAYDIVVDATDNFPARYLINDACVILKKPFVYGALHGFEGQVSVFNHLGGPTYRCLFPKMPKADEVPNCNEHGVLGIVPGIVGNLQALETVKVITGIGEVLSGKLLLYNGLSQSIQKVKFPLVSENMKITHLASDYDFSCASGFRSIKADAFKILMAEKELQILDVRSHDEYENTHLPNTMNIPLSDLEHNIGRIPKDQSVYVICQSGTRSRKAIAILQERFFDQEFTNVEGGMNKLQAYVD